MLQTTMTRIHTIVIESKILQKHLKRILRIVPIFERLVSDAEKPLYKGCTKFTRLSAILKLYNLKAVNGWSDKSFTKLLALMRDMLPEDNVLPNRTYEDKKNVMLYWHEL